MQVLQQEREEEEKQATKHRAKSGAGHSYDMWPHIVSYTKRVKKDQRQETRREETNRNSSSYVHLPGAVTYHIQAHVHTLQLSLLT